MFVFFSAQHLLGFVQTFYKCFTLYGLNGKIIAQSRYSQESCKKYIPRAYKELISFERGLNSEEVAISTNSRSDLINLFVLDTKMSIIFPTKTICRLILISSNLETTNDVTMQIF